MTEPTIKILATIGGVILTLIIFLLARYQQWKSGGGAIEKALHGDIEALGTIAYKLRNGRWIVRFYRRNTRKDIIHALCLGWSLELPPYTRALIFDTLAEITERGNVDFIKKELTKIDRRGLAPNRS